MPVSSLPAALEALRGDRADAIDEGVRFRHERRSAARGGRLAYQVTPPEGGGHLPRSCRRNATWPA
jgi:hypothetical protein